MKAVLAFPLLVAVLAGCVSGPDATDPVETTSSGPLPDFKPLEHSQEQERPATLDEAPAWKQGEWWKIRLTDRFEGKSYEATRVVVGQERDAYLVGMPSDQFSDDMMVIHLPGFGQVVKEDLSWDVHNVNFAPLRFPLKDGATWTTAFEGRPVHATVHTLSATQARIQLDGGASDHMNATYDTTVHDIVSYDAKGYAAYEVLEHGYNYTGMVTVPHMFKLVFQQFRVGPLLDASLKPAIITDTVDVDETFDRVSFGLIFAAITAQPNAGGYFDETATGPGGAKFQMTVMPTDAAIKVRTFYMDRPGGRWTFQHLAGGVGVIGAVGIEYHTYNVMMPSGEIMASTGQHQHGGTVGGQGS